MQALHDWAMVFGMGGGLFLLLLGIHWLLNRLDRLPRQQEPRNAPRTRRPLYRPGAREEHRR